MELRLESKEHEDLMKMFEKIYSHLRLDREDRRMWSKKIIYQNGEANELFLAYRAGYSYGKKFGNYFDL